jgi:hypothetical protein
MSLFHDDFADVALPCLLDLHGQAATYQDAGGDPVALTVIAGEEQAVETVEDDGRESERMRDVTLLRDPASAYGGVAEPSLHATLCLHGIEYAVRRIAVLTASYAKLIVTRHATLEISRAKYRRRV